MLYIDVSEHFKSHKRLRKSRPGDPKVFGKIAFSWQAIPRPQFLRFHIRKNLLRELLI